jgi:hypothetical protein
MHATILDFAEQSSGHGILVEAPGDRFFGESRARREMLLLLGAKPSGKNEEDAARHS